MCRCSRSPGSRFAPRWARTISRRSTCRRCSRMSRAPSSSRPARRHRYATRGSGHSQRNRRAQGRRHHPAQRPAGGALQRAAEDSWCRAFGIGYSRPKIVPYDATAARRRGAQRRPQGRHSGRRRRCRLPTRSLPWPRRWAPAWPRRCWARRQCPMICRTGHRCHRPARHRAQLQADE